MCAQRVCWPYVARSAALGHFRDSVRPSTAGGVQSAVPTQPSPPPLPRASIVRVGAAIASKLVPPPLPYALKRAEAVCFTATRAALGATAKKTANVPDVARWAPGKRRGTSRGLGVACWCVPLASSTRSRDTAARNGTAAPRPGCSLAPTRTSYCWCSGAALCRVRVRVLCRGSARWRCADEIGSGVCQHHKATRDAVAATRDETATINVRGLRCKRPRSANRDLFFNHDHGQT